MSVPFLGDAITIRRAELCTLLFHKQADPLQYHLQITLLKLHKKYIFIHKHRMNHVIQMDRHL